MTIVATTSPSQRGIEKSENLNDSDTRLEDLNLVTILPQIKLPEDEVKRNSRDLTQDQI